MIKIHKCINNKLIIQPKCESVPEPRPEPAPSPPIHNQQTNAKVARIPSAIKNVSLLHLNLIYFYFF